MEGRILSKIIESFRCETLDDFKELVSYLKINNVSIDTSKELLVLSDVIDETVIDDIYSSSVPFLKTDFIEKYGVTCIQSVDSKIDCLNKESIKYTLEDDTEVIVDFRRKQVILSKGAYNNKGTLDSKEFKIIDACPVDVKIQDTDFLNLPPRFNITWESRNRSSLFNMNPEEYVSISDIKNGLVEGGFVLNKLRLSDVISAVINCCIVNGFAEVKTMIDNKGIYFDKDLNNLIPIQINTTSVTNHEFYECKDILNKLKKVFDEEILATCIKWGMMSIFSFAMKQKKYQLPFLYMVGSSNSGKSTLGRIMMFIHDVYNDEKDLEGDSASTEYRYAKALSKNCCFELINEPYALFNRLESVQVFKSSVESLISRQTRDGVYPAFAPVIFTANDYAPETDAIYTRLYIIFFGKQLRKTSEEWETIYKQLQITNTYNSPLRHLNVLGRFAVNYIMENPHLLTDDWMKVADKIIQDFFIKFNESCPRWLIGWAEKENDIEELDDIQIEHIRSIIINELSKARGQVKIVDSEYGTVKENILEVYDDSVSKSSQFESLYWDIFNERKVSWLIPFSNNKNPQSLFLSTPFKDLINKRSDVKYTIKTLSQLLGWNIQQTTVNGSRKRGIVISLRKFLEFAYPEFDN